MRANILAASILRYLPTIRHKYFDTLAHTFFPLLHLLLHRHDVALYCNAANAIFTWMPRVFGMPVALNVDGLERKRKKWNCSRQDPGITFPNGWRPGCRTQSCPMREKIRLYYRQNYGLSRHSFPMAPRRESRIERRRCDQLGLEPGEYFLYVSRMEPENNALLVRKRSSRCRPTKSWR